MEEVTAADLVINTDVLEHVPEGDVDAVLRAPLPDGVERELIEEYTGTADTSDARCDPPRGSRDESTGSPPRSSSPARWAGCRRRSGARSLLVKRSIAARCSRRSTARSNMNFPGQ